MKKQQYVLSALALLLCFALYFGGKTVPDKSAVTHSEDDGHDHSADSPQKIDINTLLATAKESITPSQSQRLTALENSVTRGDVKDQQIHAYHEIARFWLDSARKFDLYAYYTSEAAKLENSEKSLTFAARLFLDRLMMSGDPAMQNWLASNAKVLLENALKINPANDSSSIGLGACYLFGNISTNPMEGITLIKKVVDRNPDNIYGQMMLALGGKKSGQYDKAIERFLLIVKKEPENIEAIFHIAECYDLKGDKTNAIVYYEKARELVKIPQAKEELSNRIMELKK
ncbi:tetratricopeptide repeat protein [Sediminibacterium salmoneum]|uniref:tetratricopeptide repeat protein n=1 Tax=Sediminibacterium salmoneum TaxID=426421 RepID=UPI0004B228D5|nr:tetratricopeptide repeat protein [Sediminibacterium salmoneum]